MKPYLFLLLLTLVIKNSFSQNVGIGTIVPTARLHVTDSNVLFTGSPAINLSPGEPPVSGPGARMMWHADKSAFRVGRVDGTQWDMSNIGYHSGALGFNTTASGSGSTAMGVGTIASGLASTAIGSNTTSSGDHSIASGFSSTASGVISTSFGFQNTASGNSSTAMGRNTEASGDYSTAMGVRVSTNSQLGAFVIGDGSSISTTNLLSSAPHQFSARFAGGYRLYSNTALTAGVLLPAGTNSWASVSDRNKKENIISVNTESILQKIAALPLSTWNYIGQDPAQFRHYGPMAQDFYAAFGKDKIGKIGCDTLIASADMSAINMIGIQALANRTDELTKENIALHNDITLLQKEIAELKKLLRQN